ncbi:MAG: methyltransferase domain-containing protein [Patescibacteria group bacterium]
MNRYFFILGRNQALSLAESAAFFSREQMVFNPLYLGRDFLVWETENKIDLKALNNRLGGVIKAGEIWAERPKKPDLLADLSEALGFSTISKFLPVGAEKLFLGFSLYFDEGKSFIYLQKGLERHFLSLKKEIKETGQKLRLVTSRGQTLSSVVVKKNKLLTAGAEIVIFVTPEKMFIGKTSSVQDFEGYSFRDFQRPGRDMRIGLMPPKVAQIMVNLAQARESEVILDPFAGCGTILQEAILLGYKNLVGSDNNPRALSQTRQNLEWLCRNYKIDEKKINVKLMPIDVRQIYKDLSPNSVDTIVTEPYLGPALDDRPGEGKIRMVAANLSQLYLDFFTAIKRVLKPGGKIVMIWPVFRTPAGKQFLPILEKVLAKGFEKINLIPEVFKANDLEELTSRGSILYSREDQNVLREIFVFKNV